MRIVGRHHRLSVTTIEYLLTMCFNQEKLLVEFPDPNDYVDRQGNFDDSAFANALFMYEVLQPSRVVMPSNRKRKQSCQQKGIMMKDGSISFNDLEQSFWWLHYIVFPRNDQVAREDPKFQKEFHLQFCIPYGKFEELITQMKQSGHFQRWMNRDAANRKPSPIELLTLATLHYLGRGWMFDDLEEATFINCKTICQFFHHFIDYGSTILYNMHVVFPTTTKEASKHMHEYMLAGLNGCFGSTDVTHILVDMCHHNLRQMHMGFKMKNPARAYNLTANNCQRILHTTKGYPMHWNDKTIIKFDTYGVWSSKGCTLGGVIFKLLEK